MENDANKAIVILNNGDDIALKLGELDEVSHGVFSDMVWCLAELSFIDMGLEDIHGREYLQEKAINVLRRLGFDSHDWYNDDDK